MTDSVNLAEVLKNFSHYRKDSVGTGKRGGGGTWSGLGLLKDVDHQRIAERLLATSWHNREVASALFEMAQSVERLLALRISWDQRKNLGRVLISSLTYSGLYHMVRKPEGNNYAPWYMVKTGRELDEEIKVYRTSTVGAFPKWTAPYDIHGNQLIRPSRPCPTELEYEPFIPDDGTPLPWLEAVHKLESVAYRINKELLGWALELDENESTRIIPIEWNEYDARKKALGERYEAEGIAELEKRVLKHKVTKDGKKEKFTKKERLDKKHLKNFTDDEKETWGGYWREHYLVEETQERFLARREQYESERDEAKRLAKVGAFWQRASVDYRGRLYLPNFSYQNSDFCRAVIEFAEGGYVTDDGWWHLQRHIANHSDKSGDIEDKSREALAESIPNIEIALDPIGHIDDLKGVDKPLCFLRACMELRDVATPRFKRWKDQSLSSFNQSPKKHQMWINKLVSRMDDLELIDTIRDGKQFLGHLPIEMDQSASAFQHIAGMMNDDELREKAISAESIYSGVAERLEIPAEAKEKRKIVKTIAMPWGYGAGETTCKERLLEYRNDVEHNTPFLAGQLNDEVRDLSTRVISLLVNEFDTCVQYTKRVKQAVETVLDRGQEHITWFTPSFFIVHQRIHNSRTVKPRVWSGTKLIRVNAIRPSDRIHEGENKTKAPPNLVHSYDATLVHGILWAGKFQSVQPPDTLPYMMPHGNQADDLLNKPDEIKYPVITIHDAFACHASHCVDLEEKVRLGMGALYSNFDPLQQFLSMTRGGQFSPRKINFEWVNRARNAFS